VASETSPSTGSGTGALKPTLGLTGLTANAMALIAPGAFLWLTFAEQSAYGAPAAGAAMWAGMFGGLMLCLATAVSYAELSKLYPGAGSSYFFAEQSFLSKKQIYKWARIYKYTVGWASHLYYWIYPGVMVAVTSIFISYMAGIFWPNTFSSTIGSPILMLGFSILFAYGVSFIAYKGVVGSTGVNVCVNLIQIVALVIFSVMAIDHRIHVKEGDVAWYLDAANNPNTVVQDGSKTDSSGNIIPAYYLALPDGSVVQPSVVDTAPLNVGTPNIKIDPSGEHSTPDTTDTPVQIPTDNNGVPTDSKWAKQPDGTLKATAATMLGKMAIAAGSIAKPQLNTITYQNGVFNDPNNNNAQTFWFHPNAGSVVVPHKASFLIIQMGMAILCLVGFESVTSMGEEAKNPKKHIPIAVIASLLIQGGFCYMFEYFAANYFQSSCYTNVTAAGSSAPIGDMMRLVGAWAFGSASAGQTFMIIEAVTVFLALIGTTLACINTGARVTYAMGRDEEVPSHFGLLHGKNNTPHRCIWTLATISVVVSAICLIFYMCGPASAGWTDSTLASYRGTFWYHWAFTWPEEAAKFPNMWLALTLVSNFGTFMLYMMSCVCCMVAYHEHKDGKFIRHIAIPLFGVIANLACMLFYLIGPFMVAGMSWHESYIALGVALVWGIYGAIYFTMKSKKSGKSAFIASPPPAAV